ncbi:hypothetical protein Scep_008400 [Stephania cephalantha]|uniref:RNA-dependent RNA polymerase n=1 Tax=Stephania cephalantha TaxID=152367 RepID=A0AAP0KDE0_9MAGN
MGSIGDERDRKELIVTQVSFGGFGKYVSANELSEFLEDRIGVIWRCRLKNSWTPPDSFPLFGVTNFSNYQITNDYDSVEPHAFVHFASPGAVTRALDAANRCELIFNGNPLKVSLGPESPFFVNKRRRKISPFKFSDVGVEMGALVSPNELLVGWELPAVAGVDFVVDPFDDTCKFTFTQETAFLFKSTRKIAMIKCDVKLEFPVMEVSEIRQFTSWSSLVVVLRLSSSPSLYYRTADDDIHVTTPFDLLDDDDPWIRTTDFTHSAAIGRCNSCKISFSPRYGSKLKEVVSYLKDRRIQHIVLGKQLTVREEPKSDHDFPMPNPFFCIQHKEGISFEIMFLVNAAMHKGIINQHQLSEEFFTFLRSQSRELNVAALRHICSYKCPVFDCFRKLKTVQDWLLKNPDSIGSCGGTDDNVEVRKLVITPTKAYCLPPVLELSNRVLRKFSRVSDRFLRVTFADEGMQKLNSSALSYYIAPIVKDVTSISFTQKTSVFNRVNTIMKEGFHLCGRKYSFLAFSTNQLRDHSAWFFAECDNIKVSDIKKWMGKFTDRNVAKCSARMGLCFSSTYATIEIPFEETNFDLPDIKRNGYVFSDGIGMITPELSLEIAEKLQLTASPPCAYQIRIAGCKGVIASWPGMGDGFRLSLRPSMNKFVSSHNILEVVSWTRFQPGFLNRQIIILLSALNVPENVFSRKQDSMVCKLDQMLENTDVAFEILTLSCAEEGNTAAMMLSAGFKPQTELHLRRMLSSIRVAQLSDLLAKARIFVPEGRWLMGCLDELGVLEYGQCFIQVSTPSLANCFSKHGPEFAESTKNFHVVEGTVIIAKNPCLHPGDIRILEAVDAPGLRHLVDCLVFPQKGDRPHTDEASGSDLDGDLYFVTWDEELIPPSKRSWMPMQYAPAEAKKLPRPVKNSDIIDFFTKNMVSEHLGAICNAHVVHADLSDYGAMDDKCLHLAKLAAIAVDFPKTGKLVSMPPALKPKMYPDFMGKPHFQSYKSNKILGKIYRKAKDASDGEIGSASDSSFTLEDVVYDKDLGIPGSEDFICEAWNRKCQYDRQLQALLGQYKVSTEEEVVTGHIWSLSMYTSWKQGQVKEKLKHAYHSLKKEFKHAFENLGQDMEHLDIDDKNIKYEQKASAWYQVTYHPQWVKKSLEMKERVGDEASVLLSFAWIPAEYLVKIKIRSHGIKGLDTRKPINYLAEYLAPRI